VGTLCAEQQRYYRKQTSSLVQLKYAEEWMEANLLNISLGGAAVSLYKLLSPGAQVTLRFQIPETDVQAELQGRIAWANNEGHHGVRLAKYIRLRTHLQRWLSQKEKDGWRDEIAG
jgi:hypothetical protein